MPTPEGRSWLTSRQIAIALGKQLLEDERLPAVVRQRVLDHKAVALDILMDAYEGTGYTFEFKILRLAEKLKNAISEGAFGPLTLPGAVDQNGEKILTPVGQIHSMFVDIYTHEFLDMFDEEGNMLPQETP